MLSQQPLVALHSNLVEHVINNMLPIDFLQSNISWPELTTTSLATISLTMISLKSNVRGETPKTVATIVC